MRWTEERTAFYDFHDTILFLHLKAYKKDQGGTCTGRQAFSCFQAIS